MKPMKLISVTCLQVTTSKEVAWDVVVEGGIPHRFFNQNDAEHHFDGAVAALYTIGCLGDYQSTRGFGNGQKRS